MEFYTFIKDLIEQENVTVASELVNETNEEVKEVGSYLNFFYSLDVLHLPYKAPEFNEAAAVWAAKFIFKSVQLLMLREEEEEVVSELLQPYQGIKDSSSIYSADLTLRYLPDIMRFAKGLAPDDILVKLLKNTACDWPFSSIGMELEQDLKEDILFSNPSLKYEYVDRIISKKDRQRASKEKINLLVKEVLGEYAEVLWPDFLTLTIINN